MKTFTNNDGGFQPGWHLQQHTNMGSRRCDRWCGRDVQTVQPTLIGHCHSCRVTKGEMLYNSHTCHNPKEGHHADVMFKNMMGGSMHGLRG
eukprot:9984230-Ditylum_brightwellii.AAC.1